MSARSRSEREIREIALAASSGEATDEQLVRLDQLVRSDPYFANYTARLFEQQAALLWQSSMDSLPDSSAGKPAAAPVNVHDRRESAEPVGQQSGGLRVSLVWPTIALGIAFVVGALASPALRRAIRLNVTPSVEHVGPSHEAATPPYEARLVRSTACLWASDSDGSRDIGGWLSSGQSLHLLEGLAEFTLDWPRSGSATVSLEGPAAMMLSSEGMPTLRFGRLTATINTSWRPFVLETPVGRLVVTDYGSIGVCAFGNDGEIHVFDGSATLEPAWRTTTGQQNVPLKIDAGHAIRVQKVPNGELEITPRRADADYFVAQLSMKSDALVIPPAYVSAVKEAAPIAYWRFERDAWPSIPNEMGSRFSCRVRGALGVASYRGNQVVEFGVTDKGGVILCKDRFEDEIKSSYSIELWLKPSHYHVGAVVSLISDPEAPAGAIQHGLLLELGGTGLIPTSTFHPGRIRFLHRSPASNAIDRGTSCYSVDAYTLRKWQHLVAVKDASQMRLYINGSLAAETEDETELPPGMRLLLGRLYPSRSVRPFIGQLDELAIYNRALTPKEITTHYHIVRPQSARRKNI
ncbi:MAG TPA: LamG domain-containing protein [Lacipirellulaceae bacterium]|nr:LamG domain-containing protein [Lacipirellulaceae bacterium]